MSLILLKVIFEAKGVIDKDQWLSDGKHITLRRRITDLYRGSLGSREMWKNSIIWKCHGLKTVGQNIAYNSI